jgi:hypothetical protein
MPAMAAAADPAKTAPFRDRFARVAFNAFAITRPIYGFQGTRPIVRRNMRLVKTLPINEGSRRLDRPDHRCGGRRHRDAIYVAFTHELKKTERELARLCFKTCGRCCGEVRGVGLESASGLPGSFDGNSAKPTRSNSGLQNTSREVPDGSGKRRWRRASPSWRPSCGRATISWRSQHTSCATR